MSLPLSKKIFAVYSIYIDHEEDLSSKVENEFNLTVLDVPILSLADLYGGKIVAALDRQHPRDLMEIKKYQTDE